MDCVTDGLSGDSIARHAATGVYLELEQLVRVFGAVWRLDEVLVDGERQRVGVVGGRDDEAGRARLRRLAQLVHHLGRPEHRPVIVHVSYLYTHLHRYVYR